MFEILGELSAQAQSQQVTCRIVLNSFSNYFQLYSRACLLNSWNMFTGMFKVFTESVASNKVNLYIE